MNGVATKYTINGVSLWQYCVENGYSESYYKKTTWLIRNKMLSPEEAIKYHRPAATKDQKARVLRNQRRFRGYSDDELDISIEEAKKIGRMKQAKWTYKGDTLRQYCKKNGISYNTIRDRIVKQNICVNEALNMAIVPQLHLTWKGKRLCDIFTRKECHRIYSRYRDEGWPLELAITTPIDSFYNRRKRPEYIKDIIFKGCKKSDRNVGIERSACV